MTNLARFTSGDREGTAELLTADLRCHGLCPIMRGADVHRQWEEGSIYDFRIETPAGTASIPMAKWNSFRDGRLASAWLIFDTAAMAAVLPAS